MIRTRGLSHVDLAVRDLDRSVGFYGDVFGFEVVRRGPTHAVLQTPAGPGSLALTRNVATTTLPITHFGLHLVDPGDLDTAVSLAVARGATLLSRTSHLVGGATAVLADPTGHRITL
jgi:catechol 2,3-dioxygenase-like lactoylglutathione lyase family enzyme